MIGKGCHIILPTVQTLSLLDFDLFPKLKKSIFCRHHFLSLGRAFRCQYPGHSANEDIMSLME